MKEDGVADEVESAVSSTMDEKWKSAISNRTKNGSCALRWQCRRQDLAGKQSFWLGEGLGATVYLVPVWLSQNVRRERND